MSSQPATLRDSRSDKGKRDPDALPQPGLVLVFAQGQACCVPLPIPEGVPLELGRSDGTSALPIDPRMSRKHAAVSFDGERFRITDHGSQNGTHVDGVRLSGTIQSATARVLRTGDSVFLFCGDLRPFRKEGVCYSGDQVIGPTLREVLKQVARAAQFGKTLHITGESGSGKEGMARAFHSASANPSGPFVPINCATIAQGVAERLLFGARRGAFSGAVLDSEGLLQSADGGTLFLDEVAELDLSVQAKLLRVLETREVLAMGALKPRLVNLQLCTASHRDLRQEITSGRFREDLYFRISSPTATVPPLRRRLEEIPYLIALALRTFTARLTTHALFVETCLLRYWPGNVREFVAEVRTAAQEAFGRDATRLEPQHLSAHAGQPLERASEPPQSCAVIFHPPGHPPGHPPIHKSSKDLPDKARIEEVLLQADGNFSACARLLGLHRTQLMRLIDKYGIRVKSREQSLESDDES